MPRLVSIVVRAILGGLTYDFCPWANRFVYWMKQPIAALSLAMAAALAFAIFVRPVALVAFLAIFIVVALGYLWPWVAVRGLSASLRFVEPRVVEGEPAHAVVRITNAWPWPVWGLSIDTTLGGPTSVALARVPGWTTAEFGWDFRPPVRGDHPRSPPRLVSGFPFGLWLASRPVVVERRLLVWPRTVALDTLLDAAETRPADDLGTAVRVGESGDITGTRPFRSGDSLRRVHWPQTARTGSLVVCEREAPVLSAVRVVFDPEPWLHEGSGADSTLEWSIRIAASLCAAYQRQHAAVECRFGHDVLELGQGDVGLRRFFDALARFEPPRGPAAGCGAAAGGSCGRIHPRHCGMFQITVCSRCGQAERVAHVQTHGEELQVVIDQGDTPGDTSRGMAEGAAGGVRGLVVAIEPGTDGLAEFQRHWRRRCRAG